MVVLCVLVLTSYATCCAGSAQLTISTSSSTPCYGDVVTLVCHHPEVATTFGRYLISTPGWREDGVGITPAIGTVFTSETAPDLVSTALTINITVDHFRNRSFYYSCFLVLAGASAGQLETSQNVTIDPIGEWVFSLNGTFTCGSMCGYHWLALHRYYYMLYSQYNATQE